MTAAGAGTAKRNSKKKSGSSTEAETKSAVATAPLTDRQREIYDFIVAFRRRQGCSPTITELQEEFGIRSPNGVMSQLKALETKGYILRGNRGSRWIDLARDAGGELARLLQQFSLPVFGQIPAGPPEHFSSGAAESFLSIDEVTLGFKPKSSCFALRVRGDSMKDVGILNGDLVVVEPTPSPEANQIVAALIDGECTLKRLVRVRGQWFLKAENPAYPELHPRADLVIQGVVRTVVRRLG